MAKYDNLSDGNTDGFVLFYRKADKLHPLVLSSEQADLMDYAIGVPFVPGESVKASPRGITIEELKGLLK